MSRRTATSCNKNITTVSSFAYEAAKSLQAYHRAQNR